MSQNWSSKSAWVPTWQDFHFGASSQSRKASQIFPHLRSDLKDLFRHSSMQRTTPPKALTAHQVMPHIPPSLWVWVWAVVFVQEAPGSSDQGRLQWEAWPLTASCANEAAKAAMFRAMFTAVVRASWKPDLTYTSNICDPPNLKCNKSNFKRHIFFKFQLWTHQHLTTVLNMMSDHGINTHIHTSEHWTTLLDPSCHVSNQFPSIYIQTECLFRDDSPFRSIWCFPNSIFYVSSDNQSCILKLVCVLHPVFESGYSRHDA